MPRNCRRHSRKDIPEEDRDYYLERRYPAFVTSFRATLPAARQKNVDKGFGVNNTGLSRIPGL